MRLIEFKLKNRDSVIHTHLLQSIADFCSTVFVWTSFAPELLEYIGLFGSVFSDHLFRESGCGYNLAMNLSIVEITYGGR